MAERTAAEKAKARMVACEMAAEVAQAVNKAAADAVGKCMAKTIALHGAESIITTEAWSAACKVARTAAEVAGGVAGEFKRKAGEDARQEALPLEAAAPQGGVQ